MSSNIPNTQGSFSILLNLTAYSPQPLGIPLLSGILLCNTIPVVSIIWAILSRPLTPCTFFAWPLNARLAPTDPPFLTFLGHSIPSNLALCPNDSQIFICRNCTPLIYRLLQYTSSPFPEYFTGTPKQKSSKMTSPSPNMSLCQLSPSWYTTLFRDKNLYLSSVSAIPPPPPHTAEGWTYPSPSEILSQLPSPSLSWTAYNSF